MADWHGQAGFDLLALCREVEKRPLLYDPDRRDLSKWDDTWKEIARAMNASPTVCKRQWRSVRDRFVREARLARGLGPGGDDEDSNKWSLYKYLGFLKAYKARSRRSKPSRAALERGEAERTRSKHLQVVEPVQSVALQTIQVQPVELQTIKLVAQHYPGQKQKAVVEENPECSILHPDAITQSVLLSMVNVPPPDEVITPDQPPTAMSCNESPAYPGVVSAAPSEATMSPPRNGPPLITIKQEPGVETKEYSNNTEHGGHVSSDSAAPHTFQFTPLRAAGELIKQQTAGSSNGHSAVVVNSRKRRHRDRQNDYCNSYDSNSKDDDGGKDCDDSSTDALLRELTTATERLNSSRVGDVTPCHLQHINPEDSDTMYLLSLRERLRRFGPKQKSLALLRIQEVLHEIEFGEGTS